MIIKKLKIKNFRNIEEIEIFPHYNTNIFFGENAQGKTNIIEAIWLFTGAKSFRTNKDIELVSFGYKKAVLEIDFLSEGIEKNAKIIIDEKRCAEVNGKKLKSLLDFASQFNAIIFSPQDISIVTDSPSVRRRFLDIAIGQIYPKYIKILRDYTRAVTQRNSIIKESFKDASLKPLLEDFEVVIIENGEKIIEYRQKYIENIKKFAPKIYNDLSGGKEIFDIEYKKSFKGTLEEAIMLNKREDMIRGTTSVGPHRDDLEFKINGFSARDFASQGQKRSIALTLKLTEAEIIKNITGEMPVALLDDVMSELDKTRQNYILNHIKGWQVFITCCEAAHFSGMEEGIKYNIKGGKII